MQYDLQIKHKPGILNKADALSCRLDYPQGTSEEEITFPHMMFIDEIVVNDLLPQLLEAQHINQDYIDSLRPKYPLTFSNNTWTFQNKIVVVENNDL
jgi:hypothetical protein